ncbi:hypothetical protein NERG_00824 [Nematocida ausubeli]|uniref:Uncharacterized protein n=1 Tax=Nematocida ausubeli (strain ATCC PRA-371 / ERTm2) TaxID=1913371 RepID=H8ZB75_NEMA1|nr:hypothetical protein NERG_00824 [Nematocida ausubeli]
MNASQAIERVAEIDKPEGSLLSVHYSNKTNAIYSIFHCDSPTPKVEIESQQKLASIKAIMERILTCVIAPHERFSYRFHIHVLSLAENAMDICTDLVTGLCALMTAMHIELTDTLIAYTRAYEAGSAWVCKRYFANDVVYMKMLGHVSQSNVLDAIEYMPLEEMEEFRSLHKMCSFNK